MGDQRWSLWVPWSPGTASIQLRILVPGLMEQALGQSPGNALTLAFIALLCLVINYSIAGAVVTVLCVSPSGALVSPGQELCLSGSWPRLLAERLVYSRCSTQSSLFPEIIPM